MAKIAFGNLLRKRLIEAREAEIQHEEDEALEMSLPASLIRGTDTPTAVDTGGWLELLKKASCNTKWTVHYDQTFTLAFWRSIEELGLDHYDIFEKSLDFMENPFLGYSISGQESSIFVYDLTVKGKGEFRWYYIVDDERHMNINVLISQETNQKYADDAILTAKMWDICMAMSKSLT